MPIISGWPIEYNGEVYAAGEIASLSEEEEARLVSRGYAKFAEAEETNDSFLSNLLTIEEFEGLSAADQKETLISCEITPASNAEERLKQYTEWYAEQVEEDDNA